MGQAHGKPGKIPAYKQIKQELVAEIEAQNPPPNSPYYSEREIIERYGVSRVTVRQALDLMEQDGYIFRVQGKGTFIGALETKPTKTVAFVGSCILKNALETVLVRSVEDHLNRHNFNLIVCNSDNDFAKAERYVRRLLKCRIDAIIYSCVVSDAEYARNAQLVEHVMENQVPCVLVDRSVAVPGRSLFAVTADNFRGAYLMTEHLISLGHTRIAFCASADSSVAEERMNGYLQCLADHKIPAPRDCIKKMRSLDEHQVTAMQYMMLEERPTAIVAAQDPMALALIEAFAGFGLRVPEDIAIAGFDDVAGAPSALTTIRTPVWEMGKLAASLTVDLLQGKEIQPCQVRLPVELVIRESCGVKRAARPAAVRLMMD